MNLSIAITFPNAPPPPVDGVNLHRIKRDYEVPPYTPRPVVLANKKGYPHTQPTQEKLKLTTTKAYQFWWRDLIIYCAPTQYYKDRANRIFQRVTDGGLAWCNGAGSDTNADYVNEEHLKKPDGSPKEAIKQEMLMAKGNVVNVVGERVQIGGEWWLPVEALTMDNLPPIEEVVNKFWLIHAMTTITPDLLADGTYVCNPFHDFGGTRNMRFRVPLPVISRNGIAHLPESQLERVVGAIPSPYNPA